MTPVLFHALLDRHRIATGGESAPAAPSADEPGLFASREGLTRLSQMTYGG
jgi:hypothetical protein